MYIYSKSVFRFFRSTVLDTQKVERFVYIVIRKNKQRDYYIYSKSVFRFFRSTVVDT